MLQGGNLLRPSQLLITACIVQELLLFTEMGPGPMTPFHSNPLPILPLQGTMGALHWYTFKGSCNPERRFKKPMAETIKKQLFRGPTFDH